MPRVDNQPPCHFTYVFNVQGDDLNVHLTQRSGDIALGIPFNIAGYAAITKAVAQQTGYELGEFSHTIVDAHIYAGQGDRGAWYADNLDTLQEKMARVQDEDGYTYLDVKQWIDDDAPAVETDERGKPYDHVPGLLEQLSREPLDRPTLEIADKSINDLTYKDFQLQDYEAHDGIDFGVAE
jgi:thymidylate synthase